MRNSLNLMALELLWQRLCQHRPRNHGCRQWSSAWPPEVLHCLGLWSPALRCLDVTCPNEVVPVAHLSTVWWNHAICAMRWCGYSPSEARHGCKVDALEAVIGAADA
mmetsp:Transcript_136899/g.273064  ORF Transcript_136899/g.273064 Transcript_136899/m.273064 type:complete len:107 (-) Transcript_136899:33-353(-)